MRVMALDVGSKTIGVAVSDPFGWTAQGLETIFHTTREKDFAQLRKLVDEYGVEEFVLGKPLNMDGSSGIRVERTMDFAKELAEAFPQIPQQFWDERLTTVIAEKQLIAADVSRRKRKKVIDKMAAVVILEGYLRHLALQSNTGGKA
ncbi:MAG: Holliday junction resolvase RuvX [Dialister sp.]|nr:Holliday junction resolvase RuvX [Dialister sp.]